jgi:uracil-DNA glycosylase
MTVPEKFFEQLAQSSVAVRTRLHADPTIGPYIDNDLKMPEPFGGRDSSPIKLVIIGQDPTVGNERTRREITHALMLNREKVNLTRFLGEVCAALELSLNNVYATNLCKCFFTKPPSKVKSPQLIQKTGPEWLDILRRELALFPDAAVISLGEPVLDVLLLPTVKNRMKWFWGHHRRWKDAPAQPFRLVEPDESEISRRFYPFIHLNSDRDFYGSRRADYQRFIRQDIEERRRSLDVSGQEARTMNTLDPASTDVRK